MPETPNTLNLSLSPALPARRLGELKDLAQEVAVSSSALEGHIAVNTARALGDCLRYLNSYYSNLNQYTHSQGGFTHYHVKPGQLRDDNVSLDDGQSRARSGCRPSAGEVHGVCSNIRFEELSWG